MSSDGFITFYQGLLSSGFMSVSIATVLLYEHIITIPLEIKTIWRRDKTVTSLLLLMIRWTMFVLGVCYFLQPLVHSHLVCAAKGRIQDVASILGWAEVDLFIALRVSAVWGQNRLLLAVVLVLGLAPVVTNCMALFANQPAYAEELPYCFVTLSLQGMSIDRYRRDYRICAYVTRSTLILQDATVLVLTWVKTFGQWRTAKRNNLSFSISTCLLRDGTTYFVVLLALNVAQLALFDAQGSVLNPFLAAMPLILTSRFMLNLRALHARADDPADASAASAFSSVRFAGAATRLGNIGASLDLGGACDGCREWVELEDVAVGWDGVGTLDIGFGSAGVVYDA